MALLATPTRDRLLRAHKRWREGRGANAPLDYSAAMRVAKSEIQMADLRLASKLLSATQEARA